MSEEVKSTIIRKPGRKRGPNSKKHKKKRNIKQLAKSGMAIRAPKNVVPRVTYNANAPDVPQTLDMNKHDKELATVLLQPFVAWDQGMLPGAADDTMRSTYKFRTRMLLTLEAVNDGSGAYWLVVAFNPSAKNHITYGTAYTNVVPGTPTSLTNIDDPAYTAGSGWSTYYDLYRVVGMGVRIRNVTPLQSLNGQSLMGLLTSQQCVTSSWADLSATSTGFTHSELSGGDVMQQAWRPSGQVTGGEGDWSFIEPGSVLTGDKTTSIYYALSTNNVSKISFEVVTFYESIPFVGNSWLFPTTLSMADYIRVMIILNRAFQKLSPHDVSRLVFKDDGVIDSIITDVKDIWGAGKSVVKGIKSVGHLASTVWDEVGSFFSGLFGMSRAKRYLQGIREQDYEMMRQLFADHKTRDDAIATCVAAEIEHKIETVSIPPELEIMFSRWSRDQALDRSSAVEVQTVPSSPAAPPRTKSLSKQKGA